MSRGRTLAAILADRKGKGNSSASPHDESSSVLHRTLGWIGRISILFLIVAVPWFKGGVELSSQAWIGPLLLLTLVVWCVRLVLSHSSEGNRLPIVLLPVMAGVLLGAAQWIPLSDSIASRIAPKQHELLDRLASPADLPESPPTPATTICTDSFGSGHLTLLLLYALAACAVGAHFFAADRHAKVLLVVVAINGAALSLLGLLQRLGLDPGILTIESIFKIQPYAAFVNRNNAAGYLLECLAAAIGLMYWLFFSVAVGQRPRPIVSREIPIWRRVQQRMEYFVALLTPAKIVALLLFLTIALGVIGSLSRGGVVALFGGGLITTVAFGFVRRPSSNYGLIAVAVLAVFGLTIWLGIGDQLATRFASLNDGSLVGDNDRLENWSDTVPAIRDFGWLGSGLDSYHAVHRMYRHDLESKYFEYAENQYFQTLVETGWPGLALLVTAIAMTVVMSIFVSHKGNSPRTIALGTTSLFLVTAIGIASFFDFGTYLPANALLLAVLIGMTAQHGHALAKRLKDSHYLQYDLPKWFSVATLGCLVAAIVPSSIRMRTWSLQDAVSVRFPLDQDYLALPLDRTESQIARLKPLVDAAPTYWGARRLAELYIHRYRLHRLAALREQFPIDVGELWSETNLLELREQIYLYRRIGEKRSLRLLLDDAAIVHNLKPAWQYLIQSRNRLPVDPNIHLLLAQIQPALGAFDDHVELERSSATAPTDANIGYVIGMMYLQTGRLAEACQTWRVCLELDSNQYFTRVIDRIIPPPTHRWRIPPQTVANQVIPDEPDLLFRFANRTLKGYDEPLRRELLERADDLAARRSSRADPQWVLLVARIKRDLGDYQSAIGQYTWLRQLQPHNLTARFELAQLWADHGEYRQAMDEVSWLRSCRF